MFYYSEANITRTASDSGRSDGWPRDDCPPRRTTNHPKDERPIMTPFRTGKPILSSPAIGSGFQRIVDRRSTLGMGFASRLGFGPMLLAALCLHGAGSAMAQDASPAAAQTTVPSAFVTGGESAQRLPASATSGEVVPAVGAPNIPGAQSQIAGEPVVEGDIGGAAPSAAAPAAQRKVSLPHDLSPMGMFMAADWVVKAVMLGLAFASLVTWTILVSKGLEIVFAKRRASAGVERLARADTLTQALNDGKRRWRGPVATLAASADAERTRSEALSGEGIKERVSVALSRIEAGAGRSISRGTGLLATIGSTAPFVGLFGTVWGIMNAFIGISRANTTNLAVVAPGIAEALLATAIGLVAAIPAVIIYNVFARSIAGYRAILSDGSALVLQHLSRDLDRRSASRHGAPRMAEAAE